MDWISLRMSSVYRGIGVPRGDGSAVVVIPGFLGSDQYLGDMNAWLRRIGYQPYPSGLALCAGPLDDQAVRVGPGQVSARVQRVASQDGMEPGVQQSPPRRGNGVRGRGGRRRRRPRGRNQTDRIAGDEPPGFP